MATEYGIKMDFNEAKRQASKLDDVANRLMSIATRDMSSIAADIHASWSGENAQRFLSVELQLAEDLRGRANELKLIADSIRETAQQIYNTELQAITIAQGGNGVGGSR